MFTGNLPEARQYGRVSPYLFEKLSFAINNAAPDISVLRFDLAPDIHAVDDRFSKIATVLSEMLNPVTGSKIVNIVKNVGGRAIVKSGLVQPGHRQDDKDWHVDARGAVIAATDQGPQSLSGDISNLDDISRDWLNDVFTRREVRFHPYDSQLQTKGLRPKNLEPYQWHEIPQYAIHRAPQNNSNRPIMRILASVTSHYFTDI